jgi:hypothetical protein
MGKNKKAFQSEKPQQKSRKTTDFLSRMGGASVSRRTRWYFGLGRALFRPKDSKISYSVGVVSIVKIASFFVK